MCWNISNRSVEIIINLIKCTRRGTEYTSFTALFFPKCHANLGEDDCLDSETFVLPVKSEFVMSI